jgi:hypothetical protein
MTFEVGRRYEIRYREPGFTVPITTVGEYIGDGPGLCVARGHAFRRDTDGEHGYLLIAPDLLIDAQPIARAVRSA